MRFRFHVPILILALAVGSASLTGCASGGAMVSSAPTVEQQAAIRAAAGRIADGITTANQITIAAGRFIDTLSIPAAEKAEFNKLIVAIHGTTAAPGPSVAALSALQSVTSEASLKASVNTFLTVIDPLIVKMETSPNLGIAGFGSSARAAVLFARNYVSSR